MLSERARNVKSSVTVDLNAKIAEMRRNGEKILSLNIGEPDFGTPLNIKKAAEGAIEAGFTKYTAANGMAELRKAISEKLEKENHVIYSPNDICVSVGAKQAIMNALLATCGPGDEVLLPIPCWVSYEEMIGLTGAKVVHISLKEENGYALDLEAIEKAVTSRTKAIVINTPNNPSGCVYSEESLRGLAALAVKYQFYIIADEIYEKLIYDGAIHFSVASISEEVKKLAVTVNGFSKAYAMTGWRVGYSAAAPEVAKAIRAIQSHMTSATCSISQKAALEALQGPQDEMNAMVKAFSSRRTFLVKRLNEIDGLSCPNSKGAFYLLPDVGRILGRSYEGKVIENTQDLAKYLLDTVRVAVVPGEAFNVPGKIRISYSNSIENLKEATDKLEEAIKKLQ